MLVTPTVPVPPFSIEDLLSDSATATENKEQLTLRNTRPFQRAGSADDLASLWPHEFRPADWATDTGGQGKDAEVLALVPRTSE